MGCGSSAQKPAAEKKPEEQSRAAAPAPVPSRTLSIADLRKQDDNTSQGIISILASHEPFKKLSASEGLDIIKRDQEDDTKLAAGIKIAVDRGVLEAHPVVAPIKKVDVVGKTANQVAEEILAQLPGKEGNAIILQGLSGTGKGTTVAKLQQLLPNCVCWSNGNIFRTFTHLAHLHCDEHKLEFGSAVLTTELLQSFVGRIEFKKLDDGSYDTIIDGKIRVSEIQNTLLKMPRIGSGVPTVAEQTQGEVVKFAGKAVETLKSNGCNVILEGRAQTLNYIPSESRFELVIADPSVLGERRAAQRVMAKALTILPKEGEVVSDAAVKAAVIEATTELLGRSNTALIFIKPHAQVEGMSHFVEGELEHAHITVLRKGTLSGAEIEAKGTIDYHYAAIGQYAMRTEPGDLPVSAEKKAEFHTKYGENFDEVAASKKMINTAQAMAKFGLTGVEVGKEFEAAKNDPCMVKLAPGCYVCYLKPRETYVINGFYGSMRAEYVDAAGRVSWYILQWNENALNWANFRAKVLGATDPTAAAKSSIRAKILDTHAEKKLPFVPTTSKNCVHGSASPLEGFNERRIWTQAATAEDPFGSLLLAAGITEEKITHFLTNPTTPSGKPLFDVVEDTNTTQCINALKQLI